MAYTSNPYAPRARRDAVSLVIKQGLSPAEAARKTGVHRSTISRWAKKQQALYLDRRELIPTLSSAPKSHPNALLPEVVAEIIRVRLSHNRCAYVVYQQLKAAAVPVSLSSVKRTLKRTQLTRRTSQRKRLHPGVRRPPALAPGSLVQVDTLHFIDWRKGAGGRRFYVYTLIDVYSRWAYATYSSKAKQDISLQFVLAAQAAFGRPFKMIQTDNGPEFGKHFGDLLSYKGIALRHSRIRQANDNAHVERFNRTLQDECLSKYPLPDSTTEKLTPYMDYYNSARLHMGINCQTPDQLLQRC